MQKEENFNTRTERRDAAKNREKILEAARRLLQRNDVENVSMNQIAKEAGIGPGTLYRRYSNKPELCQDLIKGSLDFLFEDIEDYLVNHENEPPNERMKGILKIYIQFRENKAKLLRGVEGFTAFDKNKSILGSPLYNKLHQIFVELFKELNGVATSTTHNIFKADLLLAAFRSDSYLFQKEVRGHTPEEILEQIYVMFDL